MLLALVHVPFQLLFQVLAQVFFKLLFHMLHQLLVQILFQVLFQLAHVLVVGSGVAPGAFSDVGSGACSGLEIFY